MSKLSEINVNSLFVLYYNFRIADGYIKSFQFKKNGISKSITLQNFYHVELSPAIETINEIIPEKYKMHLDETNLIENWAKYNNTE